MEKVNNNVSYVLSSHAEGLSVGDIWLRCFDTLYFLPAHSHTDACGSLQREHDYIMHEKITIYMFVGVACIYIHDIRYEYVYVLFYDCITCSQFDCKVAIAGSETLGNPPTEYNYIIK